MSILPGSLDYLYYNGILDHIPYEAYEQFPVANSGSNVLNDIGGIGTAGSYMQSSYNQNTDMQINSNSMINNSNYMDTAMSGNAYKSYSNAGDSFSYTTGNTRNIGSYKQENLYGREGVLGKDSIKNSYVSSDNEKSYRESLTEGYSKGKNRYTNKSSLIKGLIGVVVMAGTLFLLLKGKKKP